MQEIIFKIDTDKYVDCDIIAIVRCTENNFRDNNVFREDEFYPILKIEGIDEDSWDEDLEEYTENYEYHALLYRYAGVRYYEEYLDRFELDEVIHFCETYTTFKFEIVKDFEVISCDGDDWYVAINDLMVELI